jgi:hypothetical protein
MNTIDAVKKLVVQLKASRKAIVQLKTERLDLTRQMQDVHAELEERDALIEQLDADKQQLVDELGRAKGALEDIRDQLRVNLREMEA